MVSSRWAQFKALFLKNLSQQRHQKGVTIAQLLIPFALVALVGGVQILIDNLAEKNSDPTVKFYGRVNVSDTLASFSPFSLFTAPPFFLFSAPPDIADDVGSCTYEGVKAGLLGHVPQVLSEELAGIPETYWPFYLPQQSEQALYDHLIETYRKWRKLLNDNGLGPAPEPEEYPYLLNSTLGWLRNREYEELLPFGAVMFEQMSPSNLRYTALAATRYGGWPIDVTEESKALNLSASDLETLFVDIDRRANIINTIHNAYLNEVGAQQNQTFKITTFYQGFPQASIFTFDLSSIAGVFLYGFVTSLLLPVFISNLVADKQEKVLLMMQMSGLKMSVYWSVAYLYDMFLYAIIAAVIYITSFAFGMRMFTQTSPVLLILFFLLWGNALISLCFFFSTFFSKARTASVAGYFIVILSVLISNLLNSSVFLASTPPFYYMIYPPFAYYRGVFVFEDACIDLKCFQLSDLGTSAELRNIFLYLLLESLVLFPLTYYLQCVLPNEFGVKRSPLFFLEPLLKRCRRPRNYEEVPVDYDNDAPEIILPMSAEDLTLRKGSLTRNLIEEGFEDEDVLEERRRILHHEIPPTAQVVIRNIVKEYEGRYGQPSKLALKGVSFFIDQDECFGLLGGNGAGKTTLISLLTGVFSPSSGTALVAGHDINTSMTEVQRELGVCPQFDIFYPELTTRQHLLFYGRLKGVEDVKTAVKRTLQEMGLVSVADRQAKDLSGGMRRRLSMGIAIIGDPKIIILDEPTTGLDPLTRRQIWETLTELKKKRSMILTTHSMEEADVLCTRIGIMSRGKLKCIGTQERLKAKFGTGYSLTLTAQLPHEQAIRFVHELLPAAELEEVFSTTITFRIPKDQMRVSHVMEGLHSSKRPSSILDWGITMTTLEDVFITIAKADDDQEEAAAAAAPASP